ncbi:hypothetical protein F5I97DRAFT_1895343 [Phlebopus sp. FC_14]|nr:hypothetical protein F5I97DRAFT_1895343 [Phlebopus sp. FC_14]
MSKRKQPPTKKSRTGTLPAFAAPTEDDSLNLEPSQIPSASALSIRVLPLIGSVPSLSSLSARRFVASLPILASDERLWVYTRRWLKLLPDALVPKLFAMLRSTHPTLLSHGFIVTCFLRGPSLTLSDDLPGVQRATLASITKNGALRELRLTGFAKFADTVFASLISSLTQLRVVVLRGCSKVGTKTAEALADSCPSLSVVNLNYTAVPPLSLLKLLLSCSSLEVLKVAGISNWTDATFAKLLSGLSQHHNVVLSNLHTLKLRQLSLSESSIYPFISRCPHLRRLDLSFTHIRRPPSPDTTSLLSVEKLSLTSTMISSVDVISMISALSDLRTLSLGALGGGQGSSVSISNTSAMTMTDEALRTLTNELEKHGHLEKISLVGNSKLGFTSRGGGALADFVRRVGRKLRHLNLSGLPFLRSQDLSGLMSEIDDGGAPALVELILNHTGVDDEAAPYLSCCLSLAMLELAGTKITSDGLIPVIDACPKLEKLDLTSCRGIIVADRRRFFEVFHQPASLEAFLMQVF